MSIYGDKAYAFLEKLSFPRTSGTDEEHRAAQMIMDEIKSFGLEPKLEPFEVKWNAPTMATLKITAPIEKEYEVTGLINAQDTPDGGTDAEFYYMRLIDDVTLRKAKGKFILVNERPSEDDYKKLVEAKVAGMLWMTGTSRDTHENSDLDTFRFRESYGKHGKMPGFTIRMIDAMDLLRQKPEKVHFELHTKEFVGTSNNVVTVVPGTDLADEAIAVGGHYDSTEFSYGAWDNGAGTVQVMGLLEHLAKNPPRRTVKCICFGSEEIGLEGSKAFMKAHEGDKEKLLCMINLDVGGNLLGNSMAVVTGTPGAEEYVKGILKEGGISAKVRSSVMSSDSAVFSDYGVPSISFGNMTPRNGGYMHTRYDNMDMIDADVLGEQVETLIYVAGRLTEAEAFPIERTISKEMQEQIIKYFGAGLSETEKRKNEKK